MKHEIIYTDDYALIVSDEEIVIGDYVYCSRGGFEPLNKQTVNPLGSNNDSSMFKVIAHRSLTDAPVLKGVPLLPDWNVSEEELLVPFPNSTQTGRLRDGSEIKTWMLGWEEGFKEAKETYKYTEEDLRKALLIKHDGLSVDYVIQSLQQPKRPKYFEVSYDTREVGNHLGGVSIESIKETITNSQGQIELVGTYDGGDK